MKKRIILAGGRGFLGDVLSRYFTGEGFEVIVLTRTVRTNSRDVSWDGRTIDSWATELEDAEAVINLAGRSVDCRYHARNRAEIMDSRVATTRVIGKAIANCCKSPRVWLNASTATIYKHTTDEAWTESGVTGATPEANDAFSIQVALAWERELLECHTPATRKAALRTAMVLGSGRNSVFPVLRRLVRFGLGGKLGTGKQFVSWIHERDFCRAVHWILMKDALAGSVNLCAPNPLRNCEMMRTFREVLGVPFGLPASRWMLEIGAFFLQTETELILKSRRVVPARLIESGFKFEFPFFREAIAHLNIEV